MTMTRPLYLEFLNAFYHVTSRGDRCANIFEDDDDRQSSHQRRLFETVFVVVLVLQSCSMPVANGSQLELDASLVDAMPVLTKTVLDSDIQCLAPNDTVVPVSRHLQYVGMLASMGSDTGDFEIWKADVEATAKMGNLQAVEFIILNDDPDASKSIALFKEKLAYLVQNELHILLSVQHILFDSDGRLAANYASDWSRILDIAESFRQSIKAIFLYDEPFWNVVSNQQKGRLTFVSAGEMYDNLSTAGRLVHQTLPDTPLIFVEGYKVVNADLRIPDVFDWIGMDCYTGFENCEGKSIPEYYQTLKQLRPGKKLIAFPPGIIFKKPEDILEADRLMLKDIDLKFMNWVASEPDIIASMSFIYRYDQTTEIFTGANKICESADIHRLFWRKFSRLQNEAVREAQFSCEGSGSLNSYSMTFELTSSSYDTHVAGYYFVIGFDDRTNSWYFYRNNQWSQYDGTESSMVSFPTTAISERLTGELFRNQDLSAAPGGQIFIGHGIGTSKTAAWTHMINNNLYALCVTLPSR